MSNEIKKAKGRPPKEKDYNSPFAVRFRELAANKTNQEIADGVGVSRQTVGQFILGQSKPDVDTLCKLSEYFGVSTDYLLCKNNAKTNDPDITAICEYTGLSAEAINKILSLKEETICSRFERKYDKDKKGRLIYILSKIIEHPYFYRLLVGINNHIDGTIYFDQCSPTNKKELNDKIKEIRENGYEVIDPFHAEEIRMNDIFHEIRVIIYQTLKQEKELLCLDNTEKE